MENYLPFADQMNILFDAVQHPDGRPYTLQEVSEATGISRGTLSQMRNGRITNPQLSTLRAIIKFFNVPLRYFETETAEQCYKLIHDTRDQQAEQRPLNEISLRAMKLTPNMQKDILTIIKWVLDAEAYRKQGLDAPPLPNLEEYDDDAEF